MQINVKLYLYVVQLHL